MAREMVTYKEPKSYFTKEALKVAEKWEKEQKQKAQKATSAAKKPKK